jgi:hypothetical protein
MGMLPRAPAAALGLITLATPPGIQGGTSTFGGLGQQSPALPRGAGTPDKGSSRARGRRGLRSAGL